MRTIMVSLEIKDGLGPTLSLKRAPKYLRFVCRGNRSCSRNWDALDQLSDTPEPFETIVAAQIKNHGSVHVDRVLKGKRVGEWHESVVYEPISDQPSDEIMRCTERWQTWCLQRESKLIDQATKEPPE